MFEKIKEIGAMVASSSGMAKKITLFIVFVSFIIGVLGSMKIIPLVMDDYTKFLDNYTPTILTLIASVGIGTAVKTGTDVFKKDK